MHFSREFKKPFEKRWQMLSLSQTKRCADSKQFLNVHL